MIPAPDSNNSLYAKDRKAWRKWLKSNHNKQTYVWLLIYHQKSETPSVYYADAVEEALCFGWIDSRPNKRDHESFYLYFSRRNPKSKWSQLNKDRVSRLIKEGLMHPSGIEMVELAKKSGTWTALEDIDRMVIPEDLAKALTKNKTAQKYFDAFPPSAKKGILQWIKGAKRDETRKKRIEETVMLASQNKRANQYVKK